MKLNFKTGDLGGPPLKRHQLLQVLVGPRSVKSHMLLLKNNNKSREEARRRLPILLQEQQNNQIWVAPNVDIAPKLAKRAEIDL